MTSRKETPLSGGKKAPKRSVKQKDITQPRQSKIDLRDLTAIRREMASVYRDMRSGHIATQDGSRMIYVLEIMRKVLIEERQVAPEELTRNTVMVVVDHGTDEQWEAALRQQQARLLSEHHADTHRE